MISVSSLSLILLPIAAASGWFAARQKKQKPLPPVSPLRHIHPDYFRGLNYLINEQPDKAVDVFIKLLEVDSDTVEMHLALGNLFRQRGEVDRAIRVHQNLIARPQLEGQYRVQALSALGKNYLRAGVLDRAERLFMELVESGEECESSLRYLLTIYQQEKDWHKAIATANKLAKVSGQSMQIEISQYYCELAENCITQGKIKKAHDFINQAEAIDVACVRTSLLQARLAFDAQHYQQAVGYYKRVKQQDPDYLSEIVEPLCRCARILGEEAKIIDYFQACLAEYPRIALIAAIGDYLERQRGAEQAIQFLTEQAKRHPSLRGLSHLLGVYIKQSYGETEEQLSLLQNFVQHLLAEKPVYRCAHCGFSTRLLFWLCPSCHRWLTVKPIHGFEGN